MNKIKINWKFTRQKNIQKTKVIVHLSGGLGNQLFQFLKASQIAKVNCSEIWLNLNWFELVKYRKPGYQANLAKRKPEILRFERVKNCKVEVSRFPRDGRFERILSYVSSGILNKFGFISDKAAFGSELKINRKKIRVIGHHVSNVFPKDWDINTLLGSVMFEASQGRPDSIGVHVRLDDYLEQKFIFVPTERYYLSAISEAQKIMPNSNIFIFTDSLIQLKENYPKLVGKADKIVSTEDPISDMLDLSNSRVLIASNSTYSWWSTQFGPDKLLVIRPSNYFINSARDALEAPCWPINALALDPTSGNF